MAASDSDPAARALAVLRLEIDAIDNAIHDLLIGRAEIVDRVATAKGRGGAGRPAPLFRGGREASILRRLAARNRKPLPMDTVFGVWREIIAGLTRIQGDFGILAYAPAGNDRCLDLARAHFGSRGSLQKSASIAAALAALKKGRVQLAVLPLPGEEPRTERGWWRQLGGRDGLQILARLPFLAGRAAEGVIVGRQAFDASGDDRGYIAIGSKAKIAPARLRAALAKAGLPPVGVPARIEEKLARGRVVQYLLVEIGTWAAPDDARLRSLAAALGGAQVRSLGGYARPLAAKRK